MNVHKTVAGLAGAAALIAILAACSSSGGTQTPTSLGDLAVSSTAPSTAAPSSALAVPSPIDVVKHNTAQGTPAPNGRSLTGFPSTPKAAPSTSHAAPGVPPLSGPVTFSSVTFPRPYNCPQSGTTYYTPPNVAVAMDVTVYVTSAQLAQDLTIAAPNPAPRGLSNASQYVGSSSLGHGVWRATYRTYVGLYEPKYTPVTVSSLQASIAGSTYTISLGSPISVTLSDCHS